MSQNDFTIANQSFPAFRADLNSALQALASNNSGTSAPSTTFANMWWYDSANNILYIRNEDNDAWIQFATLDQTNDLFVVTSSIDVGDNVKALFGDGDGLQIYHTDSGNSVISETGGGDLYIDGTNLYLRNSTSAGENYISAVSDGAVTLYYDNVAKLATTATGIDVTGTAVTDGLTVAGNVSIDGGTIKLDGNYPTGTDNVALGNTALDSVQTGGNENTAIGANSMTTNTTGANNTALGINSLNANSTGGNNTALGRLALYNNTTASNNVSIGNSSMQLNTTGTQNVAVGASALSANSTGSSNVAVGYNALDANTTGTESVALGYNSLTENTGSFNTGLGSRALLDNTSGYQNVAVGAFCFENNTSGIQNVGIGMNCGATSTTGSQNTFLGESSGYSMTTGSKNTIIGRYNGNQGGLDIRTSSNNIILSDGDGNPRLHIDSSGVVKNTDFIIPFPAGAAPNGTFTHYNNGSQQTTDASHQNLPVSCDLIVKAIYLYVNGALSSGSATVNLQKNGATSATINVTTGTNAFNSTGLSISFSAGDRMGIKIVGTSTSSAWYNVSVLCERA